MVHSQYKCSVGVSNLSCVRLHPSRSNAPWEPFLDGEVGNTQHKNSETHSAYPEWTPIATREKDKSHALEEARTPAKAHKLAQMCAAQPRRRTDSPATLPLRLAPLLSHQRRRRRRRRRHALRGGAGTLGREPPADQRQPADGHGDSGSWRSGDVGPGGGGGRGGRTGRNARAGDEATGRRKTHARTHARTETNRTDRQAGRQTDLYLRALISAGSLHARPDPTKPCYARRARLTFIPTQQCIEPAAWRSSTLS